MFQSLWRDELGATLTTELLLLSTLTVAGVTTMAGDIRDGFQRKTQRLVAAIVNAGDEYITADAAAEWQQNVDQCVVMNVFDEDLPTD